MKVEKNLSGKEKELLFQKQANTLIMVNWMNLEGKQYQSGLRLRGATWGFTSALRGFLSQRWIQVKRAVNWKVYFRMLFSRLTVIPRPVPPSRETPNPTSADTFFLFAFKEKTKQSGGRTGQNSGESEGRPWLLLKTARKPETAL